ncbi:helix-turn-helix domain-containing protein [Neobacillus sp. D3-1R]|uniref:helix-turn-helix domain-containing protein n=1 Tax=Neobacillus sp. D3-1R TaxID=3445778 RepID=UPI003F9FE5C4
MGNKGSTNFVLHAASNQFFWEGTGQLSIKTFQNGNVQYKTNKGFFTVEESRYLLLNEGPYTISIEEENEVQSFCLFFKNGFAEEISRTFEESSDKLLDDPFKTFGSIGFFEKTYEDHPTLSYQIETFKMNYHFFKDDLHWLEEQFHKIMETILFIHRDTIKEVHSLKAHRVATREEIYRRISIAHDYIRSFYHQPIQLQDIAHIACLSPNHLLRNYSEIYGKTPHQHISILRISKAMELLRRLDLNMTEITFQVGFQNPVSFSKMFKQHVGISPLQFRKKVILDKN